MSTNDTGEMLATTFAVSVSHPEIAAAILSGEKTVENRHFRIKPGWCFVHVSALKQSRKQRRDVSMGARSHVLKGCNGSEERVHKIVSLSKKRCPHGCIVGAMEVSHDKKPTDQDRERDGWAAGPICNVISAVRLLSRPVKTKGFLGRWSIDPDTVKKIRTQLAEDPVAVEATTHLTLWPKTTTSCNSPK